MGTGGQTRGHTSSGDGCTAQNILGTMELNTLKG